MPDRVGHDGKEGGHPEWIIFAFHLLAERKHWRRFPAGPPILHSLSLCDDDESVSRRGRFLFHLFLHSCSIVPFSYSLFPFLQ